MVTKNHLDVEDLVVYQKLCQVHIDVCDLTHSWPREERYELGSQARRSSNSAPAQLAEKNDDRHIRNKIEGVNRSRGEAAETVHHLYMEKTLERKVPEKDRRWQVAEEIEIFQTKDETILKGWPLIDETIT